MKIIISHLKVVFVPLILDTLTQNYNKIVFYILYIFIFYIKSE